MSARQQLLDLSLVEAQRDVNKIEEDLSRSEHLYMTAHPEISKSNLSDTINKKVNPVIRTINKKIKKKIAFFKVESVEATQLKLRCKRRRKERSSNQRKKMNQHYRANRKNRKAQLLSNKVSEIKEKKLVINLSSVRSQTNAISTWQKG